MYHTKHLFFCLLTLFTHEIYAEMVPVTEVVYVENGKTVHSKKENPQDINSTATLKAIEIKGSLLKQLRGSSGNTVTDGGYMYGSASEADPGSIHAALTDMRIDSGSHDLGSADFALSVRSQDEFLVVSEWGKSENNSFQLLQGGIGEKSTAIGKVLHVHNSSWGKGRAVRLSVQGIPEKRSVHLGFLALPLSAFEVPDEMLSTVTGIRITSRADDITWIGIASETAVQAAWVPDALNKNSVAMVPPSDTPKQISVFGIESATQSFKLNQDIRVKSFGFAHAGSSYKGRLTLELREKGQASTKKEAAHQVHVQVLEAEKQQRLYASHLKNLSNFNRENGNYAYSMKVGP